MKRRVYPVVLFEEVMGDIPEGPTELRPLVAAVGRADVDAGIFADEEVHIMTGRADDRPEAFIDAPRLAELSEHDQDIAIETAFWLLQAQGVATWDPEREQFRILGVYAVVGDLRQECEAAVSVRVDVRDEATRRAAIYRVRPDLYLFEDVSDTGLHHFVFHSLVRAAGRLAASVDPYGCADGTGRRQSVVAEKDLDPHPDQLVASARTSALTYLGARGGNAPGPGRSFTCYGRADGAWVLSGWERTGDGHVELQRLGRDDLVEWCRRFISRSVPDDPTS